MDTKELIGVIGKAGKVQRTNEFECPEIPGFWVTIAYASKFVVNQIREESEEVRSNARTKEREVHYNEDKIRDQYSKRIIIGWRGLTVEALKGLLPGLESSDADKNKNVEFSSAIAKALMDNSLEFEDWVFIVCQTLRNFKHVVDKKTEEFENLD